MDPITIGVGALFLYGAVKGMLSGKDKIENIPENGDIEISENDGMAHNNHGFNEDGSSESCIWNAVRDFELDGVIDYDEIDKNNKSEMRRARDAAKDISENKTPRCRKLFGEPKRYQRRKDG